MLDGTTPYIFSPLWTAQKQDNKCEESPLIKTKQKYHQIVVGKERLQVLHAGWRCCCCHCAKPSVNMRIINNCPTCPRAKTVSFELCFYLLRLQCKYERMVCRYLCMCEYLRREHTCIHTCRFKSTHVDLHLCEFVILQVGWMKLYIWVSSVSSSIAACVYEWMYACMYIWVDRFIWTNLCLPCLPSQCVKNRCINETILTNCICWCNDRYFLSVKH